MSWRPRKRTYKLPNGRTKTVWIARYGLDAAGKELLAKPEWNRGRATFELRKDAQRAIDEELAKPASERERDSTVGGYLPRWLATRPRSERTDHTNEHRISRVLSLKIEGRSLKDWDLRSLRRRHAYELVARMLDDQRRSAGGCRAILRALSAMTEDAITDELCEINPWKGVKVREDDPRAHKTARDLRIWSFDEMHEFASFAGRFEPMIRVLSDCGLRLGECLALERTDYRPGELEVTGSAWEGRIIESSRKKNHDRIVPLGPTLDGMLRMMPVQLHSPWLFPTLTGRVWRESNWRRDVWKPAVAAANETGRARRLDPTPQEMRHSWNSHLRAAGIDPADLADVAGHSVETATKVYTHALRKSFEQIRNAIG
jgi:integrase